MFRFHSVSRYLCLLYLAAGDTLRSTGTIASNRAIDVLQQQIKIAQWERQLDDLPENYEDDIESDTESSVSSVSRTPEEIVLTQERIKEVLDAIEVFLRLHGKSERNRQILQMILFDGYSYEDTARILGVSAPVVGYIARSARDHLRRQLFKQTESEPS